MKIFQFVNSFIAIDHIRSVIIYPSRKLSGVIHQDKDEQRWTMKVIYSDEGTFKAFFENEKTAREVYTRLMKTMDNTWEDEMKFRAAGGWAHSKGDVE